jgi:SNF2 family DNA or RNA helicase
MNRRGLVLKLLTGLKQICNHPAQFLGQTGPLAGRSGKLDGLTELLEVISDEGDATLVFTQYVAMGRLIDTHLAGRGLRTRFLHGGTAVKRRTEMVDELQAGDVDVFLISLKAGGQGLNLTAADYIYILDPWWNPAVEAQAVDRAHRIGQTRRVFAYRLIARDTVEEKIVALQDRKRELAESIVRADESMIASLTAEDVELLFS